MQRIIMWSLVVGLCLGSGAARAGDEDVIWGALFGAGAGLILGESVDGWHSSVTVPIGAIAGGLMGRELERTAHRRHGGHDDYGRRRYGGRYPYYGWQSYDRYDWTPRHVSRIEPKPKPKASAPATPAPNYHPGVDVVKVEIRLVTGAAMDVRLLRMANGSFVGPQGEVYTNLPTAAGLARYSGQVVAEE
ncbi:MAG: glycine zipper 2TM domain-containing protein [Lentisphaerae bacterium]|nr:glycine zipper 2TM domain-containing protein [Lentisphaerota bacterium]